MEKLHGNFHIGLLGYRKDPVSKCVCLILSLKWIIFLAYDAALGDRPGKWHLKEEAVASEAGRNFLHWRQEQVTGYCKAGN